jgi:hypothetical protein
MLYGWMSIYWLWATEEGWPVETHEQFLSRWIPRTCLNDGLWGEGAIPQILAHYWYLSRTDVSSRPERELIQLLSATITCCLQYPRQIFPGPYFSFEDTLRHQLGEFLQTGGDPLRNETAGGSSYLAEGLLHLSVRTNLKPDVKLLWPSFTQLGHMRFKPDHSWQYCLFRNQEGQDIMVQPPSRKEWSDLVDDARNCRVSDVPAPLLSEKYILAMFILLLPYRATPEVVRFLGLKLGSVWFILEPIE